MSAYKYGREGNIIRMSDGASFPQFPGNRDYDEYALYSQGGGVTDPADVDLGFPSENQIDPAALVPQVVTMRQARLALLSAGKLSAVSAAIDSLPEPSRSVAQIEWEYSQEVRRDSDLVILLSRQLGLDGEQIDALFFSAVAL